MCVGRTNSRKIAIPRMQQISRFSAKPAISPRFCCFLHFSRSVFHDHVLVGYLHSYYFRVDHGRSAAQIAILRMQQIRNFLQIVLLIPGKFRIFRTFRRIFLLFSAAISCASFREFFRKFPQGQQNVQQGAGRSSRYTRALGY